MISGAYNRFSDPFLAVLASCNFAAPRLQIVFNYSRIGIDNSSYLAWSYFHRYRQGSEIGIERKENKQYRQGLCGYCPILFWQRQFSGWLKKNIVIT